MRRHWYLAVASAAACVAALIAGPAFAAGAVLTVGSATGPNVAVNDVLVANLQSGTSAKFTQQSGGSTGITCTSSNFNATVTSNPAPPGSAGESLTAQSFSSCTSNIAGASGNASVSVDGLPYQASVSDSTGLPVTISKSGGSLQTTITLPTLFGSRTCIFQATSITGNGNTGTNGIDFVNVQFTHTGGTLGNACGASGFFTAHYAPVQDQTQGNGTVFVN
jgi:hypothetical protein